MDQILNRSNLWLKKCNKFEQSLCFVESKWVIANTIYLFSIFRCQRHASCIFHPDPSGILQSRCINCVLIASCPVTIDCPDRFSQRLFVRKGRVRAVLVIPIAGESYLLRGRSSRACHKSWCERRSGGVTYAGRVRSCNNPLVSSPPLHSWGWLSILTVWPLSLA